VIGNAVLAVSFVALAVVVFAVAVRLGMLVGRRLDRALELRAATTQTADPAGEENRGE
jgi:hypothetical protein